MTRISILFMIVFLGSCQRKIAGIHSIETGVAESLAIQRSKTISELAYTIHLNILSGKSAPIAAKETISFLLSNRKEKLQLDFKEAKNHLQLIRVNNVVIPIHFEKEHIVVDRKFLKKGKNKVDIDFIAGDLSLNRNDDYLYTLLVPDRARTFFPCFDQPDLKAVFTLSLTIPSSWQAMTNAPVIDSSISANAKTYRYQSSDIISTYLFSFVAGHFKKETSNAQPPMQFYHRETDTSKVSLSVHPVFQLHRDAIRFMEDYTGIAYPFKKFDFAAIPDFQYGGMEHVGAIQYRASSLFLDKGATKDDELWRASVIAHETAHMWFGDLVTMRWFNDVWMKEVFANFMADKATEGAAANSNYDLKFLLDHSPAAYGIDRTAGANPIRQQLDNLQDAGSLYGNIIYHKAPIMMRQLERLVGKETLRKGLQTYLKQYAFGNASWPELISILDKETPVDLMAWNRVWVDEPGRPLFDYSLSAANGVIDRFIIRQKGEDSSSRVWPQSFEIAFVYPDTVQEVSIHMTDREMDVTALHNMKLPKTILFNSSGYGYGLFPLDTGLAASIASIKNPVMRASAYINTYENMLSGRGYKPRDLLNAYRNLFTKEEEELNLRLVTSQMADVYWRLLSSRQRSAVVDALEDELWSAIETAPTPNKKKLLFRAYQSMAGTAKGLDRLYTIWKKEMPPQGVVLTEEDYTSLSFTLGIKEHADTSILHTQLRRIKNPDRQKRFEFLMPSVSKDEAVRDRFFQSLKEEKNREKEAWVITALQYLHHPLRAGSSQKYIRPSLDLLEEIQQTGDIFFPQSWLGSTLGSHQSTYAADVVQQFMKEHPFYNPKLKAKILQAADGLFRAVRTLEH